MQRSHSVTSTEWRNLIFSFGLGLKISRGIYAERSVVLEMTPLVAERPSCFPCFAFIIAIDGISELYEEKFNNAGKKSVIVN